MQNVSPKHVKLNQDSNDYGIEMSDHTAMDEVVHDPSNWILRKEDQEESYECRLLADCICDRMYDNVI